jgi:hypothetical protein
MVQVVQCRRSSGIQASRKMKTEAGMDDELRVVSMTAAPGTGTVAV